MLAPTGLRRRAGRPVPDDPNDERRGRHLSAWCLAIGRWSFILALITPAFLLAGCAGSPTPSAADVPVGGGSFSPEAVAQSFFDDLRDALRDPKLADDQQRGAWVERLAGYFAPNESDDQRIALRDALDNFVTGMGKLDQGEDLQLELKIERLDQASNTPAPAPAPDAAKPADSKMAPAKK